MNLFGHKKPEAVFEELLERYKVTLHRYYDVTRRQCASERGSTVAFELTDIFRDAREQLTDDPESPYCIEKFQSTCDEIRARCFAQQDLGKPE
jgi:hypothetical protein